MKTISLFAIAVLAIAANTSFPEGEDPLMRVKAVHEKIRTIDCTIEQFIHDGGSVSRYAGRLRADSSGRFRIDYREPSQQTVVATSNSLLWYIKDTATLYVIPSNNPKTAGTSLGMTGSFIKKIDESMKIQYLGTGFHGFFTAVHRFILLDRSTGLKIEMSTGIKDNVILEKKIRDRDGREVMREIYGDYRDIDSMKFPHRVDVFALTGRGVVRSISKYKNVVLNSNISKRNFVLKVPAKTKVLTYGPE